MAAPIIIRAELDTGKAKQSANAIEQHFKSAIDRVTAHAEAAGRRITNALNPGAASNRFAQEAAREAQHVRRLTEIRERAAAARQVIARREEADAIRSASRIAEAQAKAFSRPRGGNDGLAFVRRYSSTVREAGESIQQAGFAMLGLTAGIAAIARNSIQSAISIDKQVNSLRALTGSAEAAETRFKALFNLAQRTPGLTTNLALTLDAQLRAASVSEGNINRLLPAVGRINAVSPLGDPQKFAQNLIQLVTQNFERTDLKELVGQSPIAGRIISQIFNVENPTNAKAIRAAAQKLGITSTDAFFAAFAQAAENNPALKNVTESLGTQIEKLQDRIGVALRPLGLRLLQAILPVVERIVPVIEGLLQRFAELPPKVQNSILVFGGLAAAIGPAVIALGGLIQTAGAIGNLVTVVSALGGAGATAAGVAGGGGLAALLPVLGSVGVAVGVLAGIWISDFGNIQSATRDAFQQIDLDSKKIEAIQGRVSSRLGELRNSFQGFSDQSSASVRGLADALVQAFNFASDQGLKKFERDLNALTSIANVAFGALSKVARVVSAIGGGDPQLPANPLQTPIVPLNPKRSTVLADEAAAAKAGRNTGNSFGGASDSEARKAAARENAIAKAVLDQRLSDLQNFAKEANRVEEAQLRNLQNLFDDGKVATGDYYRERLEIQQYALGAELVALKAQQAEVDKARSTAKDQERIRLNERFNDLQTEILNKIRAQGEASSANLREFKKALGALPGPNLDQQEQVTVPAIEPKLIIDARAKLNNLRKESSQFDILDAKLRTEELKIQNAINRGVLDEAEGRRATLAVQREYRDSMIASLEAAQKLAEINGNALQVAQLGEQIEGLRNLGAELSNADRFMRGLGQGAESTGDAFERLGQNISNSFRNIGDLLGGLKNSLKSFFADLLGNGLQSLVKQTLGAVFGQRGQQAGGTNNPFGNILGSVGNILGRSSGGGFLTPGINPNAGASGNILGTFANAASIFNGGGITAPASVSLPAGRSFPVSITGSQAGRGGFFGNILQSFTQSGIFKGFGFGLGKGAQVGSLAAAAPFLGAGLGASLGGSSLLGQLLGGAGGALLGIGTTAASGAFAAGGSLGFLAPLFSNPITAAIGAALLPTAFLIGRARQRRKDENASGDFLKDAIDSIRDLRGSVARDEIDGTQARKVFKNEILETFRQQIGTLKTKSVRESRLKNQVADLEKLYRDEVVPEIEKQALRRKVFGRLTPEFATGGIMPRDGFAFLHQGEIIANRSQQTPALINAAAAAGVPGVAPVGAGGGEIHIHLDGMTLELSQDNVTRMFAAGGSSDTGQAVILNTISNAKKNGSYRN